MTDKEKLIFGLKLIEEACHGHQVLDAFTINDKSQNQDQYSAIDTRIAFMIADSRYAEPKMAYFNDKGEFIRID